MRISGIFWFMMSAEAFFAPSEPTTNNVEPYFNPDGFQNLEYD
jgi:hypothetical protein